MTQLPLWLTLASLLLLTFGMPPFHQARAQPDQFAPLRSANDLIAEVNALRASNGLPAYQMDPILMQVAQAHSEYQASIGTVTHFSADGSRPYQRALAAGFPLAGDVSRGGFFSENVTAGKKTAAQVVAEWQGDSLHLDTMLSPNLTHVGAGAAVSGGSTYYTLDAAAAIGSASNYTPPAGGLTNTPRTPGTPETVQPIVTSTPKEDGSVLHEVRPGEALWSIALAYSTTVDDLKKLNGLGSNDIYEGQVLLIRRAATQTPEPGTPTVTVTIGVPVSTATRRPAPTPTATATPIPKPPTTRESGGVAAGVILVGALLAAGVGTWLSARKSR